jgi:hypothetical protein
LGKSLSGRSEAFPVAGEVGDLVGEAQDQGQPQRVCVLKGWSFKMSSDVVCCCCSGDVSDADAYADVR